MLSEAIIQSILEENRVAGSIRHPQKIECRVRLGIHKNEKSKAITSSKHANHPEKVSIDFSEILRRCV